MTFQMTTKRAAPPAGITAEPVAAGASGNRIGSLRLRQQRLGILHNPNRPPPPPARRAPLMGKWPSLRSSRRPRHADDGAARAEGSEDGTPLADRKQGIGRIADVTVENADGRGDADCTAPATCAGGAGPIVSLGDGHRLRIDTQRLMAAIAGHGEKHSARQPFASGIIIDTTPNLSETGLIEASTSEVAAHADQPPGSKHGDSSAWFAGPGSARGTGQAAARYGGLAPDAGGRIEAAGPFPALDRPVDTVSGPAGDAGTVAPALKNALFRNGLVVLVISAAVGLVLLIASLVPSA